MVPGSPGLMQTIYLPSDILSEGKTGDDLTNSIISCLKNNEISSVQVSSCCFDGAYFNVGVHKLLPEAMGLSESQLNINWDWMHHAALTGLFSGQI